jgi:hypothetical protein
MEIGVGKAVVISCMVAIAITRWFRYCHGKSQLAKFHHLYFHLTVENFYVITVYRMRFRSKYY